MRATFSKYTSRAPVIFMLNFIHARMIFRRLKDSASDGLDGVFFFRQSLHPVESGDKM